MLLVAGLMLSVDYKIAQWGATDPYPKLLIELLTKAEPFGHAMGVALIVITIAVLDVPRRRWAPGLCLAGAISGGLGANLVKLFVARTRPRNFDLVHSDVWHSFQGWLAFGSGGSAAQSFPSAHTATAVGMAVTLATIYPQGRWWFFSLAALVGLHRIESSAHFPSDVCVGAAIGWIVGHLCVDATARLLQRTPVTETAPASDIRLAA